MHKCFLWSCFCRDAMHGVSTPDNYKSSLLFLQTVLVLQLQSSQIKYVVKNTMLKYAQKSANTTWDMVSNVFPRHSSGEYPKNCTKNLIVQKIPRPREILFPRFVSISSLEEVIHSTPINKMVNAMKKVWITIIWRLIRLNKPNSCFQLKRLGKTRCINDNTISSTPAILKLVSIFH